MPRSHERKLDQTALSNSLKWVARSGAPIASILVPAGFFGLALAPAFKWLMYLGIVCLTTSMLLAAIGLLRSLRCRASAVSNGRP